MIILETVYIFFEIECQKLSCKQRKFIIYSKNPILCEFGVLFSLLKINVVIVMSVGYLTDETDNTCSTFE